MPVLRSPLFKALLAVITGILADHYSSGLFSETVLTAMLVGSFISTLVLYLINVQKQHKTFRYLLSLCIFIFISIATLNICGLNDPLNNKSGFEKLSLAETPVLIGKIESITYRNEHVKKLVLDVKEISIAKSTYTKVTGKLLLNCDSAFLLALNKGDLIAVKAKVQYIPEEIFPNNFNKKQYYAYQQVLCEAFVKQSEIKLIEKAETGSISAIAENFKLQLLKINQLYLSGEVRNIANALLLGFDDEIGTEVLSDYSKTGVIHILSVSGLHVALIYTSLLYILSLFSRIPKFNIIKLLICISLVWFYALLTGLSPSVTRSAIMISMVIIADTFNKKKMSYYAVFAAAFIMLLYDPNLLFNIGFQFSFTALLGILIFHSPIYNLFDSGNYFIDKIWQLISVSIAAQILTFPIAIYYFHQFPNYFLLANLVAIPLTTIIMYGCIALMIFAKIKLAAYYIAMGISFLISLLNYLVHQIASLPGALIDNLQVDLPMLFLFFLIITFTSLLLLKREKKFVYSTLLVLAVTLTYSVIINYYQFRQKETDLFTLRYNKTLLDFRNGRQALIYSDKPIDPYLWKKIRSYHNSLGIENTIELSKEEVQGLSNQKIYKRNNLFCFNEQVIALLGKESRKTTPKRIVNADYLIITSALRKTDQQYYAAERILVQERKIKNTYAELSANFPKAAIIYVPENSRFTIPGK